MFRATLATSQLIERWSQQNQRFVLGSISSVNDEKTFTAAKEKLSHGNIPKEEIMRLTKIMYVANPKLGANKAMEVLSKLRTIYADLPLQQQKI